MREFITNTYDLVSNSSNESDKVINANLLGFMKEYGGHGYFSNSLVLYSNKAIDSFCNFQNMNNLLESSFQELYQSSIVAFGQDVFCNQFVLTEDGIGFFKIETGDIDFICDDFNDFAKVVLEEYDYYSGESLMLKWQESNSVLTPEQRLTPKIPFVLGGEYELENLYSSLFSKVISFNADLALQIHNLPDGAEIVLKTE